MKVKINNKAALSPGESKKPVGRRERRSEETRENIFRAALQLFAERGFNATTIEAITEAADVGKGTFFNYFENKESLLLEYREIQMGKVRTFVANSMSSEASLTTLLFELAVKMTEEERRRPALFQSLITAIFSNETIMNRMSAGLSRTGQMLGELIACRQHCGEIRSDIAPDAVAHSFQRMVFGTILIWSLSPDTALEENLENMTDVFIHGIHSGGQISLPKAIEQ